MTHSVNAPKAALVFKYLEEVSGIERPSKHEEEIVAYVLATAKKLGLSAKRDAIGNIVVRKRASTGSEDVAGLVLQCHLDTLMDQNAETAMGLAVCLAIMEDRSLVHGPLEFLYTVDEETGCTGASKLSPKFIKGKTLLNLDAEEHGAIFIGCAGGIETVGKWKIHDEDVPQGYTGIMLSVSGLKGGHSGIEIDKNHGNAIKILNRVLMKFENLGMRLAKIDGGSRRNAIPREAHAVAYVPKKRMQEALENLHEMRRILKEENAVVEPGLKIELNPLSKKEKYRVLQERWQADISHTIAALSHGVVKMSNDVLGLVETSTNLGVIQTRKRKIVLGTSQRSSLASELEDIQFAVSIVMKFGGAKVENSEGFPAWSPNYDSVILKRAKATAQEVFGKEPKVKEIHAGLECGIFAQKFPGIDLISFGPGVDGAHAQDKSDAGSVERFYTFVTSLLANQSLA